jgi:hypothetical protein
MVAAAYAKDLLKVIPPRRLKEEAWNLDTLSG